MTLLLPAIHRLIAQERNRRSYLAVAPRNGGHVTKLLKQSDDVFSALPPPAVAAPGIDTLAWSDDGRYLLAVYLGSPYLEMFERTGNTFQKVNIISQVPTAAYTSGAFSPGGAYFAIVGTSDGRIYKKVNGIYTLLTTNSNMRASNKGLVAWSSDGVYLATGESSRARVFKRTGDTFADLNIGTEAPLLPRRMCFSQDTTYLAMASHHSFGTPFLVLKRAGDVFTRLAIPATVPTSLTTGCSFSRDGRLVAVTEVASPYLTIYSRVGDTFTALVSPCDIMPSSAAQACCFGADGSLAVTHDGTPFLSVYKRSGNAFTKVADPEEVPTYGYETAAFYPPSVNGSL